MDKIDNLQQHEDNNIYERAVKILDKYFGAVDEDDAEVAPEIENNALEEVLIGEVVLNDEELFNAAGDGPDVVNDIAGVQIDPFLPAAGVFFERAFYNIPILEQN